jgi:cardiolipin synthase
MTLLGLLVVVVLACAGAIVYVTLAVNAEADRQDVIHEAPPVATDLDAFRRAIVGAVSQPVHDGNSYVLYQNGDESFPAMLGAIASASSSIHFSSFVFRGGAIGAQFADAFAAAAQGGITVRIVIDRDGSKQLPPALIQHMRAAGCQVAWFRRAQWYDWGKYNRRTHRRLLIIDGCIAFTGGMGIADEWLGHAQDAQHWRDTHIRVEGPVVAGLQGAFVDNWNECTDELLLGEKYFPPLLPVGSVPIGAVQSNPGNATSSAQRLVAACLAATAQSIRISNAYFVPSRSFVDALCAARARGATVQIIVPGPFHNKPAVRRASRHIWPRLLAAEVELYEFQPTMIHAKTIVVDDRVSVVGSINFDPRSFALNAECAVVVFSEELAATMNRAFEADLSRSVRIPPSRVWSRNVWERFVDTLCYWFRAQL